MTQSPEKSASLRLPVRYFRFFPADHPHGETIDSVSFDPRQAALLLVDVYHAAEKPEAKDLVNTLW